jgi:hypothetical protein
MSPMNSLSSSDAGGVQSAAPPSDPNAIQNPNPSTLDAKAIRCVCDASTSSLDRARPLMKRSTSGSESSWTSNSRCLPASGTSSSRSVRKIG